MNGCVKFGFSEKATKFEKNLRRTFDKSVLFCARNSVLVKTNVVKSYYANFTLLIFYVTVKKKFHHNLN